MIMMMMMIIIIINVGYMHSEGEEGSNVLVSVLPGSGRNRCFEIRSALSLHTQYELSSKSVREEAGTRPRTDRHGTHMR